MKKLLAIFTILLVGSLSASAEALRPLNVQNASISDESDWEVRVNFDWNHDSVDVGGADVNTGSLSLPRIDIRKNLDTDIPMRVGINTGLAVGSAEVEIGSVEAETGAFGFTNLGITLEAALINEDDFAVTGYINQHIPLIHNSLQLANALRPQVGANAYGFQTGFEYQAGLGDSLTLYGDIGYRFDIPDQGATQHSLVYYNELVLDTDSPVSLSLGVLGNSVYTDDIGTDLRLVPGIIMPMGDDGEYQLRVGMPIGMTEDSADIGVQVGLFAAL